VRGSLAIAGKSGVQGVDADVQCTLPAVLVRQNIE
jgi:hypothetical protein